MEGVLDCMGVFSRQSATGPLGSRGCERKRVRLPRTVESAPVKEERRKPAFRHTFRESMEKQGIDWTKLPEKQISLLMTRFYVDSVIRRLRPGLLPDDSEDIENCYVDGANDRQVDFVYRSDDGFVLIIQSKYRSAEKPERIEDVESFCQVLRKHHSTGSVLRKNSRVVEAFADVDWENDTFELQYVTLGRVSGEVREWAEKGQGANCLPEVGGIEDRLDTAIIAESDLNELLREAIAASQSIMEPVEVRFAPTMSGAPWIIHETETGARSFIGIINAAQLRELYRRYRTQLFSMNIRNYVGDTSTNKGIIDTAEKQPEQFFFFNNGISAVATRVETDDDARLLRCERFSVVNGAQTVRSLAKAYGRSQDKARRVFVALRVSEIALKQDDFLVNVTRFNNTQNAIKVSDFRSNDDVQISLAQRFADLSSRGGKKFVYKNKRSERDANRIPIGMEEFAKTVFSFRFGPADTAGGTKHLFDTSKDGGYTKLFGYGGEVWKTVARDDFEELAGTWFVCEQVRAFIAEQRDALEKKETERGTTPPVVRDALERRWLVFFVVGELLRSKYADETKLNSVLRKLSHPGWTERDGAEKQA